MQSTSVDSTRAGTCIRRGKHVVRIGALHAGRVDEKLITARWDDVLRLATLVRTGTVSASLVLTRLRAYPRQNGRALVL